MKTISLSHRTRALNFMQIIEAMDVHEFQVTSRADSEQRFPKRSKPTCSNREFPTAMGNSVRVTQLSQFEPTWRHCSEDNQTFGLLYSVEHKALA